MTAKEYLISTGNFSKDVLPTDKIILNVGELIDLLEGYAASKQLRTEEEVRVNLEAAQNSLDLYETLRENQDDEIQYEVLKGKIELLKWFLKE